MNTGNESVHVASKSILYCSEVFESKKLSIHKVDLLGEKAGLIYEFIKTLQLLSKYTNILSNYFSVKKANQNTIKVLFQNKSRKCVC